MTTIIVLKVLHYMSLFLAGGLGVANVMLLKSHQKAGLLPALPVQKTMMTLARLGLIAIAVLWITGIPLTYKAYGSFDLGWPFHLKLLGAISLLGAVAFLNLHLIKQSREGNPPNPKIMRIVTPIARASLVLVLFGVAVLTTS
ncbi:hypothetical protein N9Y07_07025 [Alphaproteobacteria bacterium]|nr:hypothetical protein [Alphaproteobacteria bacterium]MDC0494234.1 hypothetical protein [Alphaproteobacteria bacterium]MDC1169643.1 hypothetical protein [bacterium]